MIEPPPYLSPSSAATFESCPAKWKYKYIDRRPDPSGKPALVGSFVHLVLEELCKLPPEARTLEQAKSIATSIWTVFETDEDYAALELDEADIRAFKWQAWISTQGLWKLEDPKDVEVVSTEQKIVTKLGDVPFKGIVDRLERINNELVVSDYKSGRLPGIRWRADKITQVMLYAAAVKASQDETPGAARLLYLGQRILEVKVTAERIAEATEQLTGTWEGVTTACSNESFETQPGVLCGWCSFVDVCKDGQAEVTKRMKKKKLSAEAPAWQILKIKSEAA